MADTTQFRNYTTRYDPGMGLDLICDALNLGLYIGVDAAADASPTISSAIIKFLQSGIGAVARTVQAKERDVVSVKDFGALGDGSGDTLATRFASLAAAQAVYPYASALTQTIDEVAGFHANRAVWVAGGGAVYWPAGHYVGSTGDETGSIRMRPGVKNYGDGWATYLDWKWNAFHAYTSALSAYTWYPGAAIAAGDYSITLTTPADAGNFSAGDVIRLTSVGEDSAGFPSYSEIVRVVSADAGTGVVTFEHPFEDALSDPQIGQEPDPEKALCIGSDIHDMRIECDYTVGAKPITIDALYETALYNIWGSGDKVLPANAMTRCKVHHWWFTVYPQHLMTTFILAELKQGSYKTSFEDMHVDVMPIDATYMTGISTGERARGCSFKRWKVNAAGVNFDYFINTANAVRNSFDDIEVHAKNIGQIVYYGSSNTSGGHALATRNWASDIRVKVDGNFAIGAVFSDASLVADRFDIVDRLIVNGAAAIVNGVSPRSAAFNAAPGCQVSNSVIDGGYIGNGGGPYYLINSRTGGPINTTTRTNVRSVASLTTGELVWPSPTQVFNTVVNSTTANHVVASIALPTGVQIEAGDRVRFRINGTISGAVDAKTIAIYDDGGAYYTLSMIAATTGAVHIEGELIHMGSNNWRFSGFGGAGALSALIPALRSPTIPLNFYIEAWVANAADNIYFDQVEMQFCRAEQSLSDGATSSWS